MTDTKRRHSLMVRKGLAVALAAGAALITAAPAMPKSLPQLFGTVGPGSTFVFKDKAGKTVRALKPGKYAVTVQDFSKTQNFHLVGPSLNLKTSLRGKGSSGWAIVFKAGTFSYYSDGARSKLKGTFRVS